MKWNHIVAKPKASYRGHGFIAVMTKRSGKRKKRADEAFIESGHGIVNAG